MFENPGKAQIDTFLKRIRTVAILGLSETPGRPSHNVARALQKFGGAAPATTVLILTAAPSATAAPCN